MPDDDTEQQQLQQQPPASEARSPDLSSDCSPAGEPGDGGVSVVAGGGEPTDGSGFLENLALDSSGAEGGMEAGGTEVVTRENDDDKIMEVTLRLQQYLGAGAEPTDKCILAG